MKKDIKMKHVTLSDLRLKLHLDNPNYEECYVDGYSFALAQLNENFNPFPMNSIEAQYWSEGWWSAFYEEKPLFNLSGVNIAIAQPKPYESRVSQFIATFIELSGVLMVSSFLGCQLLELVA